MSTTPQTSPPLPPHTVRIKRKRNQDPLQALLLGQGGASKRSRTNSYVFKLAATEEAPRHAGAITLLEASSPPPEEETKEVSNVLKAARNILNPARLFRFPTRKRRAESVPDEAERLQSPRESITASLTPKTQPRKRISPVPIKPAEQSVPVSQYRNEIPKVKILDRSPPRRPMAVPHSPISARRRRSSTASLSLSPTSSYQMATANEDELQKMVDLYLQLNHEDGVSKPCSALKRPHHQEQRLQQLTSGTASPDHKTRHVTGADSHMAAQNQRLAERLEAAAQKSQAGGDSTRIAKVSDDASVDSEIEDYVYDVYYREKFLGSTWDGGQYGLL
ncbi:uncharacterized protein V1513DRAFT_374807 [Lipomyces chichibuensis]|uniref:uncharacterized protein n=1 Tax=Lipomyces chichibuensis TaxID=1546026 RepID=UPI00334337FB